MGKPVWWVRANVPAAEFDDWAAFYSAFPFGPRQDDYRAGVICELLDQLIAMQSATRRRGRDRWHWFRSLDPKRGPRADDGGKAFRAWAVSRAPAFGTVRSDTPPAKPKTTRRVGKWGR